jgi:hypothetical protein
MIEKVVWSVSTKQFNSTVKRTNNNYEDFLYLFALSFIKNKQWFKKSQLVTDDFGAKLLLDGLGLQFDNINLNINSIPETHKNLFSYGKMVAYELQDEPFMHVDYDLFWYKRPPDYILNSPCAVQQKEIGTLFSNKEEGLESGFYSNGIDYVKNLVDRNEDNYWDPNINYSFNCGFMAVNDFEFFAKYMEYAKYMANIFSKKDLVGRYSYDIIWEQLTLALVSKRENKNIDTLFQESNNFHNVSYPSLNDYEFQHLLGDIKQNPKTILKLKEYVSEINPEMYEKIQYLVSKNLSPK